ncbi:MAG TPA: SRPBCC domain-containing protein [Anaerolineae bacterium]
MLPASREEVFDMWLDPESVRRWMCPGNTHVAAIELNPVVGRAFRIYMETEDEQVYVHTGKYLEIQRPERLVFTWRSPATGERESRVTVAFYEQGKSCLVVLVHELLPDERAVENHRAGWTDILNRLGEQFRDI